ncbi:MAG: acetoacetate decarboxylase family protein [Actinomycetota bacterium]
MAVTRYAARPSEDREVSATKVGAWSTSLTATFLTDAEAVASALPPPLEPGPQPLIKVGISRVDLGGDYPTFGAGTFGLAARHHGVDGFYPLFMPMTTEQAVIGGRETFGEPKKLAEIAVDLDGDRVHATVSRLGTTIIELTGSVGDELPLPAAAERLDFYLKFLRAPDGNGLDDDAWLVHCSRQTETRSHRAVHGRLELRDSRFDPVADFPILGEVTITLSERRTQQTGRLVERVPADKVLPFVHQRYDDLSPTGART